MSILDQAQVKGLITKVTISIWINMKNILQCQFCMLKSIIKHSQIPVTFHCIRMIKSKLSLVDIQCLLLINGCLIQVNSVSNMWNDSTKCYWTKRDPITNKIRNFPILMRFSNKNNVEKDVLKAHLDACLEARCTKKVSSL